MIDSGLLWGSPGEGTVFFVRCNGYKDSPFAGLAPELRMGRSVNGSRIKRSSNLNCGIAGNWIRDTSKEMLRLLLPNGICITRSLRFVGMNR